ncbi:ABC transporter ATP-binding protein [Candidatus Peregrinibacteria bacterium]|nr:ABC transporter ATP-binding protein [Candidatus Peregrinibacteria bacterium]
MLAIEIKNLSKLFRAGFIMKRVKVLDNLNLDINKGEIFGYLGPNGAGKTTTIKILLGIISPTAGSVSLLGKDIKEIGVKKYVGFLPEQPYFYDYLTANEFLHFCGQLFNINRIDRQKRIDELLRIVKLEESSHLQLRKFSKGMLQRIGIAQALINDPELIILDEPMSGLDPIGRKEIRDIILSLRDRGKTIFFSTHIIPDVEMICDRVGIIMAGKLQDVGYIDDMLDASISNTEIIVSNISEPLIDEIKKIAPQCIQTSDKLLIKAENDEQISKIIETIYKHHGQLISLTPHKKSLEDIFVERINRGNN